MFNVLFAISKAVTMFENDERFKAVERARDREDLFENYIVELERKVTDCCFKLSHMSSRLLILNKLLTLYLNAGERKGC